MRRLYRFFHRSRERALVRFMLGVLATCAAFGFVGVGVFLLWASTLTMPSLDGVDRARDEQATKIYDRTGEVVLYDMHQDVKRTVVPLSEISDTVKQATIAIEDEHFYSHVGIEPFAILRAIVRNLQAGDLLGGQGGSTLTQQVVKNALLVREKTLTRKFKEWVLAIKLERQVSKDRILELYLNEVPYGGNKYGVEEASQGFFGKRARDLTLAESAYLAALPQAPTYYSPYGANRAALDSRKNLVLDRMAEQGYIRAEDRDVAKEEVVSFRPHISSGIKAPHFVFYVISELAAQYGEEELPELGLKVVTSLDWELQRQAESIVYESALENEKTYNASNASLMALDPKTGEILVMVGSRDYFDEAIDGNYNIGLANRQPGSSFKPFAYAAALKKGYTSETIVYDVPTQFSTACDPWNFTSEGDCYSPTNYDGKFNGPITFRNALAQSVNIPAVKVLYLAGMEETINLARDLGLTSLTDWRRYGLTLVLGGGEVSLLEMTSAYGVFAHEGTRSPHHGIVRVEDRDARTIFTHELKQTTALDRDVALTITDMLADNAARAPAFGANSYLHFPGRDVAAKTGTTNDYRDAWIIGYTPEIAVGAWAGNNDNSPMEKKVAGFIVAPMWHKFMEVYFDRVGETKRFSAPPPLPSDLKPVLRGRYEGGQSVVIDTSTGQRATDDTPAELRKEVFLPDAHSILHWVNKDDPRGPAPTHPAHDAQYRYWEYGVTRWLEGSASSSSVSEPSEVENRPTVRFRSPDEGEGHRASRRLEARISVESVHPVARADYLLDGTLLGSVSNEPFSYSFVPRDVGVERGTHTLMVIVYDTEGARGGASVAIEIE